MQRRRPTRLHDRGLRAAWIAGVVWARTRPPVTSHRTAPSGHLSVCLSVCMSVFLCIFNKNKHASQATLDTILTGTRSQSPRHTSPPPPPPPRRSKGGDGRTTKPAATATAEAAARLKHRDQRVATQRRRCSTEHTANHPTLQHDRRPRRILGSRKAGRLDGDLRCQ